MSNNKLLTFKLFLVIFLIIFLLGFTPRLGYYSSNLLRLLHVFFNMYKSSNIESLLFTIIFCYKCCLNFSLMHSFFQSYILVYPININIFICDRLSLFRLLISFCVLTFIVLHNISDN